jgi:hypothetical protein
MIIAEPSSLPATARPGLDHNHRATYQVRDLVGVRVDNLRRVCGRSPSFSESDVFHGTVRCRISNPGSTSIPSGCCSIAVYVRDLTGSRYAVAPTLCQAGSA